MESDSYSGIMYPSYLPCANCRIKSPSLRMDIPRRTSNSKVGNETFIETLIDHSEKRYVEGRKREREKERKELTKEKREERE